MLDGRVRREERGDDRQLASIFYEAWRAENYLEHGRTDDGWELLMGVIARARPDFDRLLATHARTVALKHLETDSAQYRDFAVTVFTTARAHLRNAGLGLPIALVNAPSAIAELFDGSAFLVTSEETPFSLVYDFTNGEHGFQFVDARNFVGTVKVRGNDLVETVNKLMDEVFSEELS